MNIPGTIVGSKRESLSLCFVYTRKNPKVATTLFALETVDNSSRHKLFHVR